MALLKALINTLMEKGLLTRKGLDYRAITGKKEDLPV